MIQQQNGSLTSNEVYSAIHTVSDPEIPSISVVDLGIITDVEVTQDAVNVRMTPTFVGCPAIEVMRSDVEQAVQNIAGTRRVNVVVNFDIPWDTNRVTEAGRKALLQHGLAPPVEYSFELELDVLQHTACPFCGSTDTVLKSPFGPTLCRSLHYCNTCKQGFEGFKPV